PLLFEKLYQKKFSLKEFIQNVFLLTIMQIVSTEHRAFAWAVGAKRAEDAE
ncbi:18765_t:CDS:2, partial [Racocetra persica]